MNRLELDPAASALCKIHVISKTHLDIGFTAQPDEVVENYLEVFLPAAMLLNETLIDTGRQERFVWTTGSWLIWRAFEQAEGKSLDRLERAVESGALAWHALPCTFHTELMTDALVMASLKLSARMDRRFNVSTIAAKLTDVPGHTRAFVPLLADAGIEFLHVGGNGGIAPPELPPLFRWLDEETGTSICVMYHDDYGGFAIPPGSSAAIDIDVTGDNNGPPTLLEHIARLTSISQRFPRADVQASTLDRFWREAKVVAPNLPVVTSEIGDSWIYGAASDPRKLADFRALSRLHKAWSLNYPDDRELDRFGQALSLVAEHTWGLDTIVHLPDMSYSNTDLAKARSLGKLSSFERSWQRQRDYLSDAVSSLSALRKSEAMLALAQASEPSSRRPSASSQSTSGEMKMEVDSTTGSLTKCFDASTGIDVLAGPIGQIRHQIYGRETFESYIDHYVKAEHQSDWWVSRAFGKYGLRVAGGIQQSVPIVQQIDTAENSIESSVRVRLEWEDSSADDGRPDGLILSYCYSRPTGLLSVVVEWQAKRATLLPEAMWVNFSNPYRRGKVTVSKLGRDISVHDVIRSGGGRLHATDDVIKLISDNRERETQIRTLDAAVVSFGDYRLLGDGGQAASVGCEVNVNLYNNLWGTNFPLWIEGPAKFRFELSTQRPKIVL